MTNVSFPYEDWNSNKDVRMVRAGSRRAFGVVEGAVDIGDVPVNTHPKLDKSVGPVVDEVIGLLAECIEWLRHREVSAVQIQQRFNNVKKVQQQLPSTRRLREDFDEINLPSDPQNRQPSIDALGKTVKNF